MSLQELLDLEYINIQDISQLKGIIRAYHQNLDTKVKQIKDLTNIRDANISEGKTIVNKMTAMLRQNQQKIKSFELQIQSITKQHDLKKSSITDQNDKILKNLQLRHIQTIASLSQQLSNLKQQLSILSPQQNEQFEFLNQIKQKSSSLVTKQLEHHDNMNKQEEKQILQNRALFEKNRDLIKQLKRDIKMEAGRIVYQEKFENQDKNYDLKVKLFDLQDQVTKLRKDRNQIVKSKNQHKINASLNQQQIQQYKAVGSIQKSKIKVFTDKVDSMKKTISTQLSKLQTKIKEKKSKWENELKGSKQKLSNLQKQKQQLKLNLEKYKILGETILLQREEVQQFFLMAIQSCKREMNQNTGGISENVGKQYGEKVDIDELQPKDRHRIITNLYTKLALAPTK